MHADRVNVFLVAGNRLLREALARVLRKREDIYVVGAAPVSDSVTREIAPHRPDIIVFDYVTFSLSGVEIVARAQRDCPGARVLLIGMPPDERLFVAVVRQGAMGFVLNDASSGDVVAAIRLVGQGHAVCPSSLTAALFKQVARPRTELPSIRVRVQLGLTRREQQIVPLIAQGLTNKEIASQLGLSEQTIKNHLHRMMRKVGVNDRLAIVDICRGQGFEIT